MPTKPLKPLTAIRPLHIILGHIIAVAAGMYLGHALTIATPPKLNALAYVSDPQGYNIAGTNMNLWIIQSDYAFNDLEEARAYVRHLRARKPALRVNTIEKETNK